MPPRLHRFRLRRALLGLCLTVLLLGCSPATTFAPDGPCHADGKAPGAYPDLERLLPRELSGTGPTIVDSGRSCSAAALGSLKDHGVSELRFAGATWDFGAGSAATIAVIGLPDRPLPLAWAEEFYALSAKTAKRTSSVEVSRPAFDGLGPAFEVDTLNDLSFQTVIVWPDGDLARVVLVASPVDPGASLADHRAFVADAVRAAVEG